ncbi:hypothetical protein DXG01_007456 [Tephrocybe rancida]|nr:hypothetical protein DXG01_007456 [Tephrocybe rancida]
MTSPMTAPHHGTYTTVPSRMPHPEVYMDYVSENAAAPWVLFNILPRLRKALDPELGNIMWALILTSRYFFDSGLLVSQLVEALDGMNRKFSNPYIIFYPTISRDGMPFPVNKSIREIQGHAYKEETAWRGNIVIAKYRDGNPFSSMMDASMADFAILRNWLLTHGSPRQNDGKDL